jgi:hypothetical protein
MVAEDTSLKMETVMVRLNRKQVFTEGETHALRTFDMLNEHYQLLCTDEALESTIIRIVGINWDDCRYGSVPLNILGLGEQVFHQLVLTRNLKLNVTLSQTSSAASKLVGFIAFHRHDSLIDVNKLNICLHCLTSDTLHYDVDWLIGFIEDSGITAQEGHNLSTSDAIRDLDLSARNILFR